MTEKCPFCSQEFANSKALGSHIHYTHETESWLSMSQNRSEDDKEQFQKLLKSCITQQGLPIPRQTDNVEKGVTQIPEGVSPTIDQYRPAYRCAVEKEKLVKKIEEDLRGEVNSDETK